MSANLDLLALPLELLIRIFALLEGHQIVRCIAVCSYFKLAIENSITLQYVIKLDMFGYIDGPGRADSARLNQLERHIDTWNKLDWVESRIDLPISRALLEPREGIYAISNYTEVICIQLPSLHRGVPLRMWTLGFEFPVDLVEIDPSNNLLVALFTIPRSAINPSDTSICKVRVMGLLLGLADVEGLEIWNWATCRKMTGLAWE
ncbi:hypothetical protein BS47DRAFT_881028 [Hydnum rufescens UP504]|uniref:F-box domain-containing protein n=1 Tax=Hydnum rufescens UP504 TaxID=1448309 RepID=A0A9P6AZ03_9AGAM|nr:hypothetical protein BS47DRAFT_881028 [Hydnum rufescens UP504]